MFLILHGFFAAILKKIIRLSFRLALLRLSACFIDLVAHLFSCPKVRATNWSEVLYLLHPLACYCLTQELRNYQDHKSMFCLGTVLLLALVRLNNRINLFFLSN